MRRRGFSSTREVVTSHRIRNEVENKQKKRILFSSNKIILLQDNILHVMQSKKREREKTYFLLHLKMFRKRIQDKLQSIQKLQNRF
jgi:hypothetical protein